MRSFRVPSHRTLPLSSLRMLHSALESELEAMRWAVQMVTNFHYNRVIFETDSKQLVELISNQDEWPNLQSTSTRHKPHAQEDTSKSGSFPVKRL
ncbi:unnamed protein product [Microthlaspi erraticum]|uniref:RNase H type-1 domain-containing protein n=1 Tax=Microthlaspi erraticum TaxID=1685480 RepID=A0A6D2L6Q2_9BRAS|nr:unnamed protein product [Microthlaspi erraticum]